MTKQKFADKSNIDKLGKPQECGISFVDKFENSKSCK